ncbi:hypothetical protein NDA16_003048 [Ustilago loliicola]|nr:hypothetical protein NDA16_003048 [Ustilago loliicola]
MLQLDTPQLHNKVPTPSPPAESTHCRKGLDNAPLPLPLTAANNPSLTAAITAKVDAFLKQNHNAMEEAGMLDKGIQPKTFTGNISPWAKQLNWHAYWASKPVAAIGSLGSNPRKWPGLHSNFLHWVLQSAQRSTLEWMNALLQAGHQVQQTFHAFNDDISQPYSLDKSTVKKRADCWAFLITMLIFVTMDGQCLGYYSNDDQEAHLGVSDDFLKVITHLQGIYKHAIDPEVNCDAFTCAHFDKEAEVGLSAASYLLIIQELVEYGQLEHLALVHIYLHLCLSPDGTAKPVNDATSILVNLEFAFCAVMHHHLLHPDHGTVVGKPVKDINKAVVTNLKCYLHNNSHSSSGHLQSLLCYGTKLA